MSSLPEEIIEENILTRLPVKSISRFRCVSKKWRFLFQNPNFIQKHLNHAILMNKFKILVTNDDGDIPPSESHLYSIDSNLLSSPILGLALEQIEYPITAYPEESKPIILGSCNGLVCIETYVENYCIWNPATGEYKQLPEPSEAVNDLFLIFHGFGFDCKNDDYKLLKMARSKQGESEVIEARLYSLASNSWKNLGCFPFDFEYCACKGLVHDGVVYWVVDQGFESWVIVCFDLSDETFRELPVPRNNSSDVWDGQFLSELGILEGRLCILYTNHMENPETCTHENDLIDVWKMIDNKWCKHLEITAQIAGMCYRRPIQTLQNGDILLEVGPRREPSFCLMSCDPNFQRVGALNIHDWPDMPEVETYIETLVPLNTATYVEKLPREESTYSRAVGLRDKIEKVYKRFVEWEDLAAEGEESTSSRDVWLKGEIKKLKQGVVEQAAELEAQAAVLKQMMFRQLPEIDGPTEDEDEDE